jgi:rhodanese-related sulfurtransferase
MKDISLNELDTLMKNKDAPVVINVLDRSAFEQEHIPGSINIPIEEKDFMKQVQNRVQDKSRPIVVYCASTECPASHHAAEKLESEGYKNILCFKGGMEEWTNAGKKVEAGT